VHLAWAIIGFVRIYLCPRGQPREAASADLVVGVVFRHCSVDPASFSACRSALVATSA
jgi:hypothetical protein